MCSLCTAVNKSSYLSQCPPVLGGYLLPTFSPALTLSKHCWQQECWVSCLNFSPEFQTRLSQLPWESALTVWAVWSAPCLSGQLPLVYRPPKAFPNALKASAAGPILSAHGSLLWSGNCFFNPTMTASTGKGKTCPSLRVLKYLHALIYRSQVKRWS